MKRKIAIVTCSSACIPEELAEKHAIHIVPMTLVVGDGSYRDGIDITTEEFYRAMRQDGSKVSTSAPSVGQYLGVFKSLEGQCESVLCITLADSLSASHRAATTAAAKIDSMPVEVFDSKTAATGQALVVLAAARSAGSGGDLEAALSSARHVADKVKLFCAIETLEYLRRSGRINFVSAFAAGALNIKPVFELSHGRVKPIAKTRSKRRALEKIARIAVDTYNESGPLNLAVFHAMAEDEAQFLCERIKQEAQCADSFIAEFTPVVGKHTGPGLVGASFY